MREIDIIKKINEQGTGGRPFIKWWRTEEDWVEFDLVDRFLASGAGGTASQEIEGYELATEDEVWNEAKRLCGDRLSREGDTIRWERDGKTVTCIYAPDSILKVLDVETKGNFVD